MPATRRDRKIFVLDTSVLLYDYTAVTHFGKNDVAIPITVLEELDQFKKGNNVINLHAREFIRYLDRLSDRNLLQKWIPLNGSTHGKLRVLTDHSGKKEAASLFGTDKNDHRILDSALRLRDEEPGRRVILVSKDINLRLKARAVNLEAEDYETIQIKDVDHIYKGKTELEVQDELIDRLYNENGADAATIKSDLPEVNHYYVLKNHSHSALAYHHAQTGRLLPVSKRQAYGVAPRNVEQTFALHALLNPDVQLVTITGAAGTGKTLLALAAALEQRRDYRQIYLARPIVPLSNRDLGYLPGDIESKIDPYMQPLWDNLAFIKNQYDESSKAYSKIEEMLELGKLRIMPLAYIRGRSLANIMFIVDEAQNLTPHEVKTIITRSGEGTKMVFTGDIFQIDTPYLDTESNGLSYLVDRMRGQSLYAHINLEKGERSELANLASKVL